LVPPGGLAAASPTYETARRSWMSVVSAIGIPRALAPGPLGVISEGGPVPAGGRLSGGEDHELGRLADAQPLVHQPPELCQLVRVEPLKQLGDHPVGDLIDARERLAAGVGERHA